MHRDHGRPNRRDRLRGESRAPSGVASRPEMCRGYRQSIGDGNAAGDRHLERRTDPQSDTTTRASVWQGLAMPLASPPDVSGYFDGMGVEGFRWRVI
jgi:hypothetical protein